MEKKITFLSGTVSHNTVCSVYETFLNILRCINLLQYGVVSKAADLQLLYLDSVHDESIGCAQT